jgi:hypothetical protein
MRKKRERYARRFDWDEAKRLYAEDVPIAWIAAKYQVTASAIRRIVVPGVKEAMAEYSRSHSVGQAHCEKCGKPTNLVAHKRGSRRCPKCAAADKITTVREDTLHCTTCKQWKPDEQFHNSRDEAVAYRRYRRSECKACANARRVKYREDTRIPCKGGCGRTVSPSDQRAYLKHRNPKITHVKPGWCSKCSPRRVRNKRDPITVGAAKFREKFRVPSYQTGTTENQ